jgi:2'-5' RNA ligase
MMMSYSIWLMPSGKINDELSEMIAQLSHQFATPLFPPHVTLIGNLNGSETELSLQTQQLAARMASFWVKLTAVDTLDEYFRCLFLRVEETLPLLDANQQARKIFQREQDAKFLPHLSLMYGNFDYETKTKIIASIGREFNQLFSVSQLHLFSTTGEPKVWYRVQNFVLQG